MSTCDNNNQQTTQSIADYLAQLLKDRKQLAAFPAVFTHVERLLDEGNFYLYTYVYITYICLFLTNNCMIPVGFIHSLSD